jgi:alkylhydroperoxidase family enzyme
MSERIDYNEVAPRGAKALAGVQLYVSQSGLAPPLPTAVYLRVSLINGCAYCIDMHSRELRDLGVSVEKTWICFSRNTAFTNSSWSA